MKTPIQSSALQQAVRAFLPDVPARCTPYGAGHINDTFAVFPSAGGSNYILQRINTDTFTDPAALMENICGVTDYLRARVLARGGDPAREVLTVIFTKDKKPFFRSSDGNCWRLYLNIEHSLCLQAAENEADFAAAAKAFGHFQCQLAEYPVASLHETIPHFHDTPQRYAAFEKALADDACGRAADLSSEIAFLRAHKAEYSLLTDQLADGRLPRRVTHNDTKLNNVLLDAATRQPLCVIDLDTVMPGLTAYDFGDAIRFGANDCAEDEQDQSRVHFSLPLYRAYYDAFTAAAGGSLIPAELESLPWGAKLMTLECGIRFLTDYLEGDHYFHIVRPEQNLDRARTQFTLVKGMENCWTDLT